MPSISEFGIGEIGGAVIPSQLMYPGLSQAIVETALPAQVFRQTFVQYPTAGKQAITVPIEAGSKTALASRIGEGDEFPLDISPITASTITVYKIGRGHTITREMILFQQVPIIQHRLKRLGLVMGNTIDYDCAQVINSGAGNTAACSGKSLGVNMTETTLSGTIGQYDIVDAKVRMWSNNLFPDTLVVNPTGLGHLIKLPMYHAEWLYGAPVYQTGEQGHIEGLRILVSMNCPQGTAFVINTNLAATPLGQFAPMGYFAEALPITTTIQDNPRRDAYEVYSMAMYAPAVVKGDCIEKLTY